MKKKATSKKSAIELLDESVHLLRTAPAHLLSIYYTGTLPFVLGLLYFWGDMSRNAFAAEYCAPAALGIALLFIWMKCWHSVFAVRVLAAVSRSEAPEWPFRGIIRLITNQTAIQGSGLLLLPAAMFLVFPFGWFYAFYQNALIQSYDKSMTMKEAIGESIRQARLWPGQNHILLFAITLLSMMAMLNVGMVVYGLPYLLDRLLGIETIFTMSGISVLNTTFLASVCGITFLCLDPLVKTVYVLRYFYGLSLSSGNDLKARLRGILPQSKPVAGMVLLIIAGTILYTPYPVAAGETANAASPPAHSDSSGNPALAISPGKLDQSIREIMTRRKFAWRMPRENEEDIVKDGPFDKLLEWIRDKYTYWKKTIETWLDDVLPEWDLSSDVKLGGWEFWVRLVLYIVIAGAGGFLIIHFLRKIMAWKKGQTETPVDIAPFKPDLTEEYIKADDLPSDQWMALASEMLEKGSMRLALRALYLASLARLAEEKLISIAKYKSNRDYETEIRRRAHDQNELLAIFSKSVHTFDKVWYGMYEIGAEDVTGFAQDQERMFSFAGQ